MEESRTTLNRWKRLLEINSVDTDLARLVFSQEVENKREVYNSILRYRKVESNFLEMKELLQRLNADKKVTLTALVEKVESLGGVESLQKPAPQPTTAHNFYAEYSDARNALNAQIDLVKFWKAEAGRLESDLANTGKNPIEALCEKYALINMVDVEKAFRQYDPSAKAKLLPAEKVFPFGVSIPPEFSVLSAQWRLECPNADKLQEAIRFQQEVIKQVNARVSNTNSSE